MNDINRVLKMEKEGRREKEGEREREREREREHLNQCHSDESHIPQ